MYILYLKFNSKCKSKDAPKRKVQRGIQIDNVKYIQNIFTVFKSDKQWNNIHFVQKGKVHQKFHNIHT